MAFIVVGFFIIAIFGAIAGSSDSTSAQSKSILHLDMNEPIMEQSVENPLAIIQGGSTSVTGLNDIIRSIERAEEDDNIKGIYIKLGMASVGWGSLEEIRSALKKFKGNAKDKFIYAYGEGCSQKAYYVASVADSIFVNPHGGIEFKGLAMVGSFVKGLMDKLDVHVEGFHVGKYKGAHEPFSRKDFSGPNGEQLRDVLQDLNLSLLTAASERSGKSVEELQEMANSLSVKFPKDAARIGLIDGVAYDDDVRALLRKKSGLKEDGKLRFVTPGDYAKAKRSKSKDKVAVLYAQGSILDGEGTEGIYSATLNKEIRKIANDDKIKAVVLRINSGGGSALASEVMHRELLALKKKKPLYISMGDVAASGGYYMACAGDSIFADKNTITGSIGVVGVMFNMEKFLNNKLGVTFDEIKTAQHADFPTTFRTMDGVERSAINTYLDSVYFTFKSRVAEARNMSMEEVEALAQGHVYSGTDALDLKLVDVLDGKNAAIAAVAKRAGLDGYKVVEYPKQEDSFTQLLNSTKGGDGKDVMIQEFLGKDYALFKQIKDLRNMQNKVMAIMPWTFEIR